METYLRLFLVDHGFPRPIVQLPVWDERGQLLGYVDLGYREQRIGIEYEGDYHRDRVTFRRDIARVNAMQEAGWVIVRLTASDLRDPIHLLGQLRSLLAARSQRSARRAGGS
jgi:very-short-patch-repair endonuclease